MIWLATASAGFQPVTTPLSANTRINWTDLRLEVDIKADPGQAQGTRATEELARRQVEAEMGDGILQIPIDQGRTMVDLREVPELWSQLEPRMRRWAEIENRYYTSGHVAVVGAIRLVDLLKPLTMATAQERPRTVSKGNTGLVLDARGLDEVKPCFTPTIRGPRGELYDGSVWLHVASERAGAVWVSDAAAPAAERVGEEPLLVHATKANGCTFEVDAKSAREIEALVDKGVLGEGTLAIVVDE